MVDITGGETFTGVSAVRIIQDEFLPHTVKSVLVRNALSNDPNKSLSKTLIHGINNCLASRAKQLYKYAERGDYHYGPTVCKAFNTYVNRTAIMDLLEDIEGTPVNINYMHLSPINMMHVTWQRLVRDHGYNPFTNRLAALSTTLLQDVYLEDIVIYYVPSYYNNLNDEAKQVWGAPPKAGYCPSRTVREPDPIYDSDGNEIPPPERRIDITPPVVSSATTSNYAVIKYAYVNSSAPGSFVGSKPVTKGEFVLPLPPLPRGNYYQVKYSYVSGTDTHVRFWTYLVGSGTYPDIDDIDPKVTNTFGQFYPLLFFIRNAGDLTKTSLKDTDAYKSSKKACKYIGLDYASFGESIQSSPEIDKVTFAFVTFGVPMTATDQIGIRYLFEFFTRLLAYEETQFTDEYLEGTERISGIPFSKNKYVQIGTEGVNGEAPYRWQFVYNKLVRKRKLGTIGDVGTYTATVSTIPFIASESYVDSNNNTVINPYSRGVHTYRYQKDIGIYEEIVVYGAEAVYKVTRKHFYDTSYKDESLIVPLDHSIVSDYHFSDAEVLYARSMYLIVSAKDSVKTAWYNSEAFRLILIVVVIIITIITFNPAGAGWLSTYLGYTGYTALVIDTLASIALNSAFTYGFKKLAEEIGLENAAIAVVVAYAANYMAGGTGSNALPGLPFAGDLLAMASSLVQGITAAIDDYMKDIEQAAAVLEETAKSKQEAIDQAQNLLGPSTNLDPSELVSLRPLTLFGESPNDYYQRTVHSGNVGVIGIDAVSSYVSNALSLPKLYQTIDEV